MQTLDSTIIGTALPAIGASFAVDPVRLHMAMTSYLIALAVFMPMSGWVADRYGTRNVFRVAILIFVGASIGCGAASSLAELVAMRIVQGFGGALMVPVARLALLRAVPKSELVQAMTWVTVPALVGPVVGPPLGGFLVTYAAWPWIFWINVPFGILGICLATAYFEDIRGEQRVPFDGLGFVYSGLAIGGILFGFELMPLRDLVGHAGHALAAAGLIAVLFVGGFVRSLQFTALNSIAFADLDERQMSRATGFTSMAQQLSLSIGVSIAALSLSLSAALRGEAAPQPTDYAVAFIVVTVLVLLSAVSFLKLESDAGAAVSRHATTVGGAARTPSDPRT
ncbi:MFS transporter [Stappia sp. F7233]|uniref:MFS transporter n=2 Tax=Stappia albiluteola TaxID=2758565 RepID=A0A839AD48_9HYPH|nr:MFS transporter [Stappia albiluteola]